MVWSYERPGLVSAEAPAVQARAGRVRGGVGVRPLLVRSGGSIPLSPRSPAGVPAIVTGFALNESNVHSPNERIVSDYLPLGVGRRRLFRRFADLG